jgi:hypothetical protein
MIRTARENTVSTVSSVEGAGLDGEGADRAIIVVATMRVVFGYCPRDQVPDFTL